MVHYIRIGISILAFLGFSTNLFSKPLERSIFLNGIDITSAKHQTLENVTIKIDGQGHIYIEAPHYEVNEESTYIPLSSWNREGFGLPKHQPKGPMPKSAQEVGSSKPLPRLSKQATSVDGKSMAKVGAKGDSNPKKVQGNKQPVGPADGASGNKQSSPASSK